MWFGHRTSPHDAADAVQDQADELFRPGSAAQRVDFAAYSIIAHLPRNERSRWNGAADATVRENLKTSVGAWYAASSLSRDAFRTRFLDPYLGDPTVDRLRAAASGIVEARSRGALGAAAGDLAVAAQTIGSYTWSRVVSDAATKAVAAVSHGEVPGATLVQAGVASGGAAAVSSGVTSGISPGTATLGRVATRVITGVASAVTMAQLATGAAVLGAVVLTVWIAKNGKVSTVSIQGFGPADHGVAPISAEVNGTTGTVLLYHGPPTRPPDTGTQHTVELRAGRMAC